MLVLIYLYIGKFEIKLLEMDTATNSIYLRRNLNGSGAMTTAKVFISYSWSTSEHEAWVLNLATDLMDSGIETVLDKWDLKEGDEATAFMERMVSDPDISKVLIISDRLYAEKSNERKGGAGTEAQIISQEIFSQQDLSKFVVAVTEKQDDGSAYTPAYYTSRIFIDFSDSRNFAESFEQLLRWITDQPIYKKPPIGKLPSYLTDPENAISMPTNAAKRHAIDALSHDKTAAFSATKDYFELFTKHLDRFRFDADFDPLAASVLSNFGSFIPYRDEFLEVVRAISSCPQDERYGGLLHSCFERLIPFFFPPSGTEKYNALMSDNFKFFGHELFLHCVAVFIAEERYDLVNSLVEQHYYSEHWADRTNEALRPFWEFRHPLHLLLHRADKLEGAKWLSPTGQLLKERVVGARLEFHQLMQADFVLFLRSSLLEINPDRRWFPATLAYIEHNYRAFEVFERSRSKRYFERVRPLFAGAAKEDLVDLVNRFGAEPEYLPRWQTQRVAPALLMGIDNICTMP